MSDPGRERAFVAGATGYTGRATVERLCALGISTVAHVRPDSPRLAYWDGIFGALGVEVDQTPWDEIDRALVSRRPTQVFALLGTTRKRMRAMAVAGTDSDSASYDAVDFGLTAALIRAASRCEELPHFVYLSAQGARPGAVGGYLGARVRAEACLAESGLSFTVLRPALITGEDRQESRPGERFAEHIVRGALGAATGLGLGKYADHFRTLDAATLARGMVTLAQLRAPGVHGPAEIWSAASSA